jgi:hypothetical protein
VEKGKRGVRCEVREREVREEIASEGRGSVHTTLQFASTGSVPSVYTFLFIPSTISIHP